MRCQVTHQGRQERHPTDAPVLPEAHPQRRSPAAACPRLQSGQLSAHPGAAGGRRALVADDTERPANQDWRQDRMPRALRHIPDGRGRHCPGPVRRHPAPHRPPQTKAMSRMTARTSINDEPDGISAPRMSLTRPFYPSKAANRRPTNRIGLPGAARNKLVAGEADTSQSFRAGTLLYGKSRLIPPDGAIIQVTPIH
jgi:hypothetical protein